MNHWIAFFAKQRAFGNLITIFLIIAGLFSLTRIQREAFPNVKFDLISIRTLFPGATPEEVERLVTNVIEQELKEIDGVKNLFSSSTEGLSEISVQLNPDETTAEKSKDDIQSVIDRLTTLPVAVEDPVVTSVETKYQPVVELFIFPEDRTQFGTLEFRRTVKALERDLKNIGDVAKIQYSGWRKLEYRVEPDLNSLSKHHLTLEQVISAIQRQNQNIPGGKIEGSKEELLVRTLGEYQTQQEIEQTVIRANDYGESLRLKDVARVSLVEERPSQLGLYEGQRAIRMLILQKEKADSIRLSDSLKARIQEVTHPESGAFRSLKIRQVNDVSDYISRRINVLNGNLLIGLALVLLILSLILPVRVAILVSLGIPFAFLGTMVWFYSADISLNLVSLIGLIIVCGMLVDDAIVVTDNCVRYIEQGMDPEEAAIKGTQEIWPSVAASVLTTIVAFLPLMFMSGIFGKFVKPISYGVVIALLMSLFEAFFVLPGHIASYVRLDRRERKFKALQWIQSGWEKRLIPAYSRLLERLLSVRYRTLAIVFGIFIGTLILAATSMKVVLFPPNGVEIFAIRLKAPSGSSLVETEASTQVLQSVLLTIPTHEKTDITGMVGESSFDPLEPGYRRGSEYAYFLVFLSPAEKRQRTADEIMEDVRKKVGNPPQFEELRFARVSSGPPVGKPVSLSVTGEELSEVKIAVDDLKLALGKVVGVKDIGDTYSLGKKEIRLTLRQADAVAAGLDTQSVGTAVRAAFEGIVASSIRGLDEEIDIRVLLTENQRTRDDTIRELSVLNSSGQKIPLNRVVQVTDGRGLQVIDHKNNRRQINVTADVDYSVISAGQANDAIRNYFPEFQKKFPNIGITFGGEDEDTQEAMGSLGRAFVLAFMAIFLILVMTFQSVSQSLLVMLTLPLGIMSALFATFVHGWPITFMGIMGIIALAGVIVNNAIVMIEFVNQLRREGHDLQKSIVEAATIRFRPIFLTTVTTVFGLLPTAYGIGGLDEFVVPIALALGWGLLMGSILTAIVFPLAIAMLDDIHAYISRPRV